MAMTTRWQHSFSSSLISGLLIVADNSFFLKIPRYAITQAFFVRTGKLDWAVDKAYLPAEQVIRDSLRLAYMSSAPVPCPMASLADPRFGDL